MTACTERHTAARAYGFAGEGQKGMPSQLSMTACTERHTAARAYGLAGEGKKKRNSGQAECMVATTSSDGMSKEGTA